MQQGITPTPDVDSFDPNIDPGASRTPGKSRDSSDGLTDEDIPIPQDVEDRESIEEPNPEPSLIEEPFEPPSKPPL